MLAANRRLYDEKQVSTPKQPHVIVTNALRDGTCTTDIWSSATVDDVLQITGSSRARASFRLIQSRSWEPG
jgi:hypothetical protein